MRTGQQYLDKIASRKANIYIGSERVEDVTQHAAYKNAARVVANMYDEAAKPENRDILTFSEDGRDYNAMWLRPRSAADLEKRNALHRAWAQCSYGLFGRSADHVAGWITGMSCMPSVFERQGSRYVENIEKYYRYARENDLYIAYAVVTPAGAKSSDPTKVTTDKSAPSSSWAQNAALRVVKETDEGLIISGFKILATGAILADEILFGNYQPLAKGQEAFAVACAVPVDAPGLTLISRGPFVSEDRAEVDNPLAYNFDETDAVVYCDNVLVPWDRVFAHNHTDAAKAIFNDTPAHVLGNVQAHIRHLEKLRLLLGVMERVLVSNQIIDIPAVRDMLGLLATRVAMVDALVIAETANLETWEGGYVAQDRQALYATMAYTMEYYPEFIDHCRQLIGSHYFQLPADSGFLDNPVTSDIYMKFSLSDNIAESMQRYKLMRLAWDLIGSEFASRHTQYEMFYNGPRHVCRARALGNFRWDGVRSEVDRLLSSIEA